MSDPKSQPAPARGLAFIVALLLEAAQTLAVLFVGVVLLHLSRWLKRPETNKEEILDPTVSPIELEIREPVRLLLENSWAVGMALIAYSLCLLFLLLFSMRRMRWALLLNALLQSVGLALALSISMLGYLIDARDGALVGAMVALPFVFILGEMIHAWRLAGAPPAKARRDPH